MKQQRTSIPSTTVAALGIAIGLLALTPSSAAAAQKVATPSSSGFSASWNKSSFSHAKFDTLLRRHVAGGKVDYNAIRSRSKGLLDEYLFRVAKTRPSQITGKDARLSFWINAYNAITIRAVLDRLPAYRLVQRRFRVTQIKGFWTQYKYEVGGRWYSLNQIEHSIIRPRFRDARIHFALVCAAKGCPWLQGRAYTAAKVQRQLAAATRQFLQSSSRGFKVHGNTGTVYLSQLFKWYRKDFRMKPYAHELDFVAAHLSVGDKAALQAVRANPNFKIKYLQYNWALNIK